MPRRDSARKPDFTVSARLLAWYDSNRRTLPWRVRGGVSADPYRVWLSEIMLQQTTARAVVPYYLAFLARWPTVRALATAPLDEVLAAWSGLGYYARARNLHRTAGMIVREFGGRLPNTVNELLTLPGIGSYTAAAISAIAFGAREIGLDANVQRVLARYFAVRSPLPKSGPRLRDLGKTLIPESRNGDFVQAMMDLGHEVCTSKMPRCEACPLKTTCRARALGLAMRLPAKAPRRVRPLRRGAAFVAVRADGAILLSRRPENGLLGGMLQPPLGRWSSQFPAGADVARQAPFRAQWVKRAGVVRHTFTHFDLEIEVYRADVGARNVDRADWRRQSDLPRAALPTVMRKIIAHGLTNVAAEGDHKRSARNL
ncbi:MAG: A/G-specific adenine glycosylase [Alphaproteobacteria bacterium]|nr:A/G-specific adenine glycosylase [Alphaproteobacteria bacterium]